MRALVVLLALGALLVAGGCSQVSVQTDFDPKADFTALKTYSWYNAEQPKEGDPRLDNPLLDQRVRSTVETVLNAKGYVKDDVNPDFWLVYHAAVSKEIGTTTTTSSSTYGGYYGWYYVSSPVWVETPTMYTYNQGTLILDIVDAKAEKLIWRGSAQANVDNPETQQQRKNLMNEAVNGMLSKFPPKPGK
jgi:hypothetical protein